MLPTTFPEQTLVLEKPPSMTDEECMNLPVHVGFSHDGFPTFTSCWRFSKEDLEDVNRTGCIYLQVTGYQMPPVGLQTENPFQFYPLDDAGDNR